MLAQTGLSPEKKFTEMAEATEIYMKKSYHSMTVPTVAATMTLRCNSMVGSATGPTFGSFLICTPNCLVRFRGS